MLFRFYGIITVLLSFVGVGLGYSILNSLIGIYYNVIIALAFYYLFGSLTSSLPWASCDNDWNTPSCGDTFWFNTSGQLLCLPILALLSCRSLRLYCLVCIRLSVNLLFALFYFNNIT